MSARLGLLCALFAPLSIAAGAPDDPPPARRGAYGLRYATGTGSKYGTVEVLGIDPDNLSKLAQASWTADRWADLLSVSVEAPGTSTNAPPPIAGTYRIAGPVLRFEPRFPAEPGLRYRVRFRPARLPVPGRDSRDEVRAEFTRPAPPSRGPTSVVRVDPASGNLPENLLKFYVHFSAPMTRGEVYQRVRILDDSGHVVDGAFLELGEELWDPSETRITLLLDPGRIKRGLKPREEAGPILRAGRSYTLVIDRAWPDAEGHPLREGFRKPFRAGPADETQPNPKSWKLATPAADTREPLTLAFPEPLDRAILERAFDVVSADGKPVSGRAEIASGATNWSFRPDQPWRAGRYKVVVDTTLEDLAGNSIAHPFEVDVFHPVGQKIDTETVSIPVTIAERAQSPSGSK